VLLHRLTQLKAATAASTILGNAFGTALGIMFSIVTLYFTTLSAPAHAITPSPAMLEQFQQLPKGQQQQLMKQYGLSPQSLGGLKQSAEPLSAPTTVAPRYSHSTNSQSTNFAPFTTTVPAQAAFSEQPLKPFGYDMFASEPATFAPVNDIPVPTNYLMGPGDQVSIQLYGKQNNQYELTISRSGQLQVPELGPVNVTGLTFNEMKQKLTQLISSKYIGMQANISLGQLRSIRIFVAGDAYKPGSYTVSSLSTITQALFAAGGINDIGSLRNIQLKRNGKRVATFDLYDLLMRGDASNDKRLQSGDVVFIPPVGATVSVKGQVRRPAIYELSGKANMAQLLRLAGGLKPGAYPAASIVERFNNQQLPSLINVNLTTKRGKATTAKNGDVLNVQNTATRVFEQIALMGAVNRPGLYQWHRGIRVNDLLKSTWSDLTNSADLSYALVVREINPQGDINVIQINLQQVMANAASTYNLALRPRDTLMVFNNAPMSLQRGELDQLISQQISPYLSKNYQAQQSAATPALFAAGFATLNNKGAANKQNSQELNQAAIQVQQVLFQLFNDKKLLKLSRSLTRQEMLYPVLAKLRSQSSNINTTHGTSAVQITSITGAVRFPGFYPLTKHQSITDLVTAAGGLKDSAYLKQAELSRNLLAKNDSVELTHVKINLAKLNPKTPYLLQSQDQLQVLTIPQWQQKRTVELVGEVKFPGIYSIKNGESMMSVISRAGGFTNDAFVRGAVFTRESVKEQERLQIVAMADQLRRDIATKGLSQSDSSISFDEASKMLNQLEQLQTVGRMVIDLASLEANYQPRNDSSKNGAHSVNNATNNNLRLDNGDKLYVPSQQQIVTVVGEVQHASSHFYQSNLDIEQYLTLAGGIKQRADDERIYIISANGAVSVPKSSYWFGQSSSMQPGDTIVVPLDTEYKDSLKLWSQVTGIIYNTAVAFAAINGI